MDKADIIAHVRLRLPPNLLETITDLSGEEVLAVFAAVFERAWNKAVPVARARLIRDATGPVKATGSMVVHFASETVDAYEISIGQPVFQSPWGVRYVLTEAITRTASQAAGDQTVAVEAEYAGWDGNVRGDCITEWAKSTGNVDAWTFSGGTAPAGKLEFLNAIIAGDATFTAGNMTGGRAGTLDLRAQGRGMPRALAEADVLLRRRLRTRIDAITPNGIVRAVNRALGYDAAQLIEYWDYGFAMGVSAMGDAALVHGTRDAVVIVPVGSDVVALQALVSRIKAAGSYVIVLEAAP